MPANTTNYNLQYPVGTDSIDTAGDIERLALSVDRAINLNWDTATTEQRAAVANANAPVNLFGKDRPDGRGKWLEFVAPVGSTFTFSGTQAELDDVYGARVWRKTPSAWKCIEGEYTVNYIGTANDKNGFFKLQDVRFTFGPEWCAIIARYIPLVNSSGTSHFNALYSSGAWNANSRPFQNFSGGVWMYPVAGSNQSNWGSALQGTSLLICPGESIYKTGTVPGGANMHTTGIYPTGDQRWPSSSEPITFHWDTTRKKEELETKIKEIEEDPEHEHHQNLNDLKAEIESIQEAIEEQNNG